jgi:hypothetical protein
LEKNVKNTRANMEKFLKNRPNILLQWTPRVIAMIYFVFLMLFSMDVFSEKMPFWPVLGAFFIHSIPAFILLAVLVISWKYEVVGAVFFVLFGIVYIVWVLTSGRSGNMVLSWILTIAVPSLTIGALFLANWMIKRRKTG